MKHTALLCRDENTRGKVVIVGAGPAGALAAIYLAKQRYNVEASQLPKS